MQEINREIRRSIIIRYRHFAVVCPTLLRTHRANLLNRGNIMKLKDSLGILFAGSVIGYNYANAETVINQGAQVLCAITAIATIVYYSKKKIK